MSNTRRPRPQAAKAVKAEALETAIQFEFEGVTYTIPPTSEWSVEALEAAEDGKVITFVRSVLGPEQWAAFKAVPRKAADLDRFGDALMEAAGLGN
jgi:hypothetical protein